MAAPVVGVGLQLIDAANALGTWENIGGGTPTAETDFYIEGTGSVASRVSGTNGNGAFYNRNATRSGVTWGDDHVYIWLYCTGTANLRSINDAGGAAGLQVILVSGTNDNNYGQWFVSGSEDLVGGWRCYPVFPTTTPDAEVGTYASTDVQGYGVEANTAGNAAGRNIAADVVRVGSGLTISRGESGNAAGFSTITAENDNINNQYGVFRSVGTGAELQGKITIGVDDTTTDTFFEDFNFVITNPNKNPRLDQGTFTTSSTLTGLSIVGSATTCLLNNCSFFTVDEYDKGYFTSSDGTNDPLNVELDGCTFSSWGPTTLSGLTTATNTTWINCEAITLNSGTLDQCTVETGIGGTYVFAGSTPDNISNVSFIGGGTGGGHGLEITASGSYDFVNNSFSTFGDSDGDDAAIHVNGAGVDVTLNISGNEATTAPTYKLTGVGATIAYVTAVSVNVTGLPVVPEPQDATEIRVLVAGQDLFATSAGIGTTNPDVGIGTESHRTDTFTFSITKDFDFDLRIINLDYEPQFISSIRSSLDPTNVPANLKLDRVSQNDKQ